VSNLLDGEVGPFRRPRRDSPDRWHAAARAGRGLNGATQVRVGVRPEKLRCCRGRPTLRPRRPDSNTLDGTVLDASYIGVSTQYLVETADGHKLTVYAQNLETSGAAEALADGQAVRLAWKPQHTFVIDRSAASGQPDQQLEEEAIS
jgi:spermidine/putrescine transport system ATP-binding protein